MSDAMIPPPSEADMRLDLLRLHEMPIGDDGLAAVVDRGVYFWSLIRRCHAAETALATLQHKVRVANAERDDAKMREAAAKLSIAELREALQPFADIGIPDNWPAECVLTWEEERDRGYAYISYLSSDVDAVGVPKIADYHRATTTLARTAPGA